MHHYKQTGDRNTYFTNAARKTKFISAFRILHQRADGDDVSTLYELDIRTPEGTATMPISEWHAVKSGQVASTFMVFNPTAGAARLLGNAPGTPSLMEARQPRVTRCVRNSAAGRASRHVVWRGCRRAI